MDNWEGYYGTYVLNKENFTIINFVVTDHNRQSRIVGFAIVACERQIVVDAIMSYFKILNDTSMVQVAMTDKDLKEDTAISKAFPKARILYCFWHNENTLRKRFKSEVSEVVKKMMLTDSENEFNSRLEDFYEV